MGMQVAISNVFYDRTGSLLIQNVGDGQTVESSYNDVGKVTEVSGAEGSITYQYDERGYLLSVENVNGDVVSYTYDEYGNRTSMTYPDGRVVSYTYDRMNRMTGVTGLDGEVTAYTYDAAGRRTETSGSTLTTSYRYDSVGNLVEQVTHGESEIAFSYAYDRNGYITGEIRRENGTTVAGSYAYDAAGQLTEFLQTTGYGERYAYDKAGNMTEKVLTGTDGAETTLAMKYNKGNQLTGMANGRDKIAYKYDKNGSMVEKTLSSQSYGRLTDSYAYNALDQLTEYVGYDGYRQAFTYDANGMRQSKSEAGDANRSTLEELLRGNVAGLPEIVESAQSQTNADEADVPAGLEWATTEYLYDLTQEYYQVISETTTYANGTSATTAYAYGLERIAAYNENGVTRYVYDGRGSVAQAVNVPVAGKAVSSNLPDVGVQVQSFAYTAYGEQMGDVKVSGFTYNAEAYDAATGMLNLRARQYEPALGRFSQKDIVRGHITSPSTQNRYIFCLNSSLVFSDPSGESIIGAIAGIVVTLATTVIPAVAKAVSESIDEICRSKARTACQEAVNGHFSAVAETFNYYQANYASLPDDVRKEYDIVYEEYQKTGFSNNPRITSLMLRACAKIAGIELQQPPATVEQTQPTSKNDAPALNKLEGLIYALEHCENPNTTDFKDYDSAGATNSDCANYVSQVLYSMGMPMWVADDLQRSGWIYKDGKASTSWKGDQSLYYSLVGKENKYNNYETSAYYGEAHKIHLTDSYEFKPMDLVFVRYKGDNSFGHVMIVAGYDPENKPFFSSAAQNSTTKTMTILSKDIPQKVDIMEEK